MLILSPDSRVVPFGNRVDHRIRKSQFLLVTDYRRLQRKIAVQIYNNALLHCGYCLERVVLTPFPQNHFKHLVKAYHGYDQ